MGEGSKFMKMQFKIFIGTCVPSSTHSVLGIDDALREKVERVTQYKQVLAERWPDEFARLTKFRQTLLASGVLDSLIFAGGASVPSVLRWCLALLWSQWGQDNLPSGFALRMSNLRPYVLETIRRFPPVGGVGFVECSPGDKP